MSNQLLGDRRSDGILEATSILSVTWELTADPGWEICIWAKSRWHSFRDPASSIASARCRSRIHRF
ncbi:MULTISPECIES: hypothetical protein [Aerosakkonema]|uniref:hypothetical protein n=1 Tax=Aerosakkonema TaxID=1246629 RepID=UPI0035BBF2C7